MTFFCSIGFAQSSFLVDVTLFWPLKIKIARYLQKFEIFNSWLEILLKKLSLNDKMHDLINKNNTRHNLWSLKIQKKSYWIHNNFKVSILWFSNKMIMRFDCLFWNSDRLQNYFSNPEGVWKIIKNCMTSFMDDPLVTLSFVTIYFKLCNPFLLFEKSS